MLIRGVLPPSICSQIQKCLELIREGGQNFSNKSEVQKCLGGGSSLSGILSEIFPFFNYDASPKIRLQRWRGPQIWRQHQKDQTKPNLLNLTWQTNHITPKLRNQTYWTVPRISNQHTKATKRNHQIWIHEQNEQIQLRLVDQGKKDLIKAR